MLWRAGLFLFIVWSCVACETATRPIDDPVPADSAVIVVPGFYGTKLVRESDGVEVWIDTWEALFRSRSLRLPLPGLELGDSIPLRPDGILQQIKVIPLIYSVEGYGSLLKGLRESSAGHGMVVSFPYDWRRGLMEAVQGLGNLVEQLRAQGRFPIAIVAHSMGGLVTSYYLRYGAQDPATAVENWEGAAKADVVVMAGVPFLGSMTQFRNMQDGVRIGLNRSLLDRAAVASFPASYYLLPAAEADVLLTPDHGPLKGAIHQARNWREHDWGLLKDAHALPAEVVDRRFAYTSLWIEQASRFSKLLLAPPGTPSRTPAPLLYVSAKGSPTLAKGIWLEHGPGKSTGRLLFDDDQVGKYLPSVDPKVLMEDGDGTVTRLSASLPTAYGYAFHVTSQEATVDHAELMSEPGIQRDMVDFLVSHKVGAGSANYRPTGRFGPAFRWEKSGTLYGIDPRQGVIHIAARVALLRR